MCQFPAQGLVELPHSRCTGSEVKLPAFKSSLHSSTVTLARHPAPRSLFLYLCSEANDKTSPDSMMFIVGGKKNSPSNVFGSVFDTPKVVGLCFQDYLSVCLSIQRRQLVQTGSICLPHSASERIKCL